MPGKIRDSPRTFTAYQVKKKLTALGYDCNKSNFQNIIYGNGEYYRN